MNSASLRKVLALTALAALLSGCGSNVHTRGAPTNVITSGSDWSSVTTTGDIGAECTNFDSGSVRLSGKVTTYYFNGKIQEDRVRVRLTNLPANFESTSTVHIKFYRWKADQSGTTSIDSTPLNFFIEAGSPARPISGILTSISSGDVGTFRAAAGVSSTAAQDFFNAVSLTVTGTDYNWNALKVVVYEDTTTLGMADLLLPIFAANPNTYGSSHAGVLNGLHPFWAQRGQTNVSDNDWVKRSQSYCF